MRDDNGMGTIPPEDDLRPAGPLREALRRARVEAAERSDVVIDLRQAEIARLEILRDALLPVFAEIPPEIDLFDVGLSPGERPRLFVDMVSFVEMARDRRTYRFMRDGRHGRTVAAESEQPQPIVDAITSYVARRLIERERLLADDDRLGDTPRAAPPEARSGEGEARSYPKPAGADYAPAHPARASAPAAIAPRDGAGRRWLRMVAILFAFLVGGGVGAAVVAAVMVAASKGLLPGIG